MTHLHFLGISGSLMAGAARLAQAAGYSVSGSDRSFYPPMGEQAKALKVPLFEGYDADVTMRPADCYVVGNAVVRGNPLMESIMRERRPYISAAQWLGETVLRGRRVLAVAGTHGKTTTASLLAWMLQRAGLAPGFLLGGVAQNFGMSAHLGESPWFVIEADEYDSAFFDKRPKFMHYRPAVAVLNNLEFDHADIYDNAEQIVRQFHYLLRTIPADGTVLARAHDAHLAAALEMGVYAPVMHFCGGEWRHRGDEHEMSVWHNNKECCRFVPPLLGEANRDNILAAVAAAHVAGAAAEQADKWLAGFLPPLRRLQKIADANDILLYDDFAHHPTAYRKTLAAVAAAHPQRRLVAVFEPRSHTMKAGVFAADLAAALAQADSIVAVGEYPWLNEALFAPENKVSLCVDAAAAAALLQKEMRAGDCVILMSNGDFGGLPEKIAAAVKHRKA